VTVLVVVVVVSVDVVVVAVPVVAVPVAVVPVSSTTAGASVVVVVSVVVCSAFLQPVRRAVPRTAARPRVQNFFINLISFFRLRLLWREKNPSEEKNEAE
jgi:hypothetical protein